MTDKQEPLKLRALLGDHPHLMALKQGEVTSSYLTLEFEDVKMAYPHFKRAVRDLEFDVAELALTTYMQARAYGKPLVLLPVVLFAANAPHAFMVYNAERGKLEPKDLVGRRVGIRAPSVTTVMWVRGILQNDYGVDIGRVKWVAFEEPHVAEFKDPSNVERAPADKKMLSMLLAGELDAAVVSRDDPGDARIVPLIPGPEAAARKWCTRRHMRPINHMLVVRQALTRSDPQAVREIFRLFAQCRQRAGLAPDMLPLGVEANRRALQAALDYATQQQLVPRRLQVDDLFDDVTKALGA